MSETQGAEKTGKRRGERDSKGRFLPGNTDAVAHGCGRPPVIKPIRELAKQYSEAAIMALVSIMQDGDSHPSARVAAAKEILDRGEGKVTQPVDTPENSNIAAALTTLLAGGTHVLNTLQQQADNDSDDA